MNTNEISGKRQMEFLAEFDYIREAGTVGEEKAATIIQETLNSFGVENHLEEFGFETFQVKKAKLTITEPYVKEYTVTDAVKTVSRTEKEHFNGDGFKVALLDLGTKNNIIRSLEKRGCDVTVYPADTTAEEILGDQPDGIMLSNGPGDPKECVQIIKEIKKLYDSEVPIFAICLGHQLMALATGADTEKMRWGHRGGNHPVKDLKSGRVYISSQNHGYVIKEETIDPDVAEVSFINVNDKTIEGLDYKNKNIRTVQFHPEACPGPQDTAYLFDEFMDRMKGAKNA